VNARIARRRPELFPAIPGEHDTYAWDGGDVFYTHRGAGRPMLLLHSHNAAASSYEVRRAFEAFAPGYRVFAPDLPGYGLSERRPREYFGSTYVRFIHDFVHDVIGEPAIIVAASVTASQALVAAAEDPQSFSHVIAVAPTGLTPERASAPAPVRALGAFVRLPVWGSALFNAITSKAYIQRYLHEFVYFDQWNVTHEMVDYAWRTAHQENASYAPASFLNGNLWLDARDAYAGLRVPVLVVWGEKDRINPYEGNAPLLSANPTAHVSVVTNAGAAPYDEQPEEFAGVVNEFLAAG
jgi:pimeloyl-ACP methyl ester carboxylesterase